jgi:class 3 adenylate cyclase
MADLQRMDRTWLCSVLFMDIVKYSSQSVDMQMKWKARFNGYLAEAIRDVPESERVILDTGDGAAVCFLGAPEAAMFAALQLWQCFVSDEREQQPGLRVRIGVNLGPVKLVKDLNGSLNAIGDGINAGQRIMSFAQENQILVSQSFFEVVSRLSDDYKVLFKLKGVETDKHVREHTVYSLLPPGSEKWHAEAASAGQPVKSQPEPVSRL